MNHLKVEITSKLLIILKKFLNKLNSLEKFKIIRFFVSRQD